MQGYVPTPKEHLVVKEEPGVEKEESGKSREAAAPALAATSRDGGAPDGW